MADQYKTETRYDGNNQPYEVRLPIESSVISTDTLRPSPQIKLANIPQQDIAGLLGTTQGAIDYTKSITDRANLAESSVESSKQDISKLMTDLLGKTADTQAANETSGLNAVTKQLNELNAQAQSLNREAQAIPLQTQERNANTGATDAGVAPQNTSALRNNAIKALSIAQQTDVASANYVAAKDKAQQIIDLKYKPLEELLAIKKQQYEFNKDTLMSIDKKRTEALTIALKKEERDINEAKAKEKLNNDRASDFIKYAMESGQSDIASQISSLDPASKTFSQDLSKLQSQIKNPMMGLDIAIKQAQLVKLQKETRLLGEPTPTETRATKEALQNAKASLPAMQDKVDAIDILKNSDGLANSVGTNFLSRKSAGTGEGFFGGIGNLIGGGKDIFMGKFIKDVSGSNQQFAGGVHKLVGGLTLQSLIDAKARGATFGALSDSELNILANSASALNDWEIKDSKGKGIGVWNIDQSSFKKELDNIKELTNRAILLSQGTLMSSEDQSLLDELYNNQDASNFYK